MENRLHLSHKESMKKTSSSLWTPISICLLKQFIKRIYEIYFKCEKRNNRLFFPSSQELILKHCKDIYTIVMNILAVLKDKFFRHFARTYDFNWLFTCLEGQIQSDIIPQHHNKLSTYFIFIKDFFFVYLVFAYPFLDYFFKSVFNGIQEKPAHFLPYQKMWLVP